MYKSIHVVPTQPDTGWTSEDKVELNLRTHYHLLNSSIDAFNRLIGRCLELVEIVGIPEAQEKALKSRLKDEMWLSQNALVEGNWEIVTDKDRAPRESLGVYTPNGVPDQPEGLVG